MKNSGLQAKMECRVVGIESMKNRPTRHASGIGKTTHKTENTESPDSNSSGTIYKEWPGKP